MNSAMDRTTAAATLRSALAVAAIAVGVFGLTFVVAILYTG
jgi:hypothetical protein